jgi:hypothetical protein
MRSGPRAACNTRRRSGKKRSGSSNGLPEEEDIATTLIEAGVYVDDKATLREVDSWFMSLFNRSKIVTPDDLAAAKAFRNKNDWKGSRSARRKRPLVEALSTGGEAEFSQQRIYFAFFDERMSQARERQARQFLKRKSHAVQRRLALDPGNFRHLVYYDGFDRMPKDAFIIDIYRHRRGFSVTGPYKTFSAPATWNGITYVLSGRHVHFNYLLTRADKATIRKAASALWKLDKPILDLRRAAPVLLKHS